MRDIVRKRNDKIRYVDYAVWQKKMLSSPEGEKFKKRWRARLLPLPDPLNLPTDKPRPLERSFKGGSFKFLLDSEKSLKLKEFSNKHSVTLFETLGSVISIFLFRHTSQRYFIIGVPVSGRVDPSVDGIVGCFVNTLPIPIRLEPSYNFIDVIERFSSIWRECLEDQIYPFESIVEAVGAPRDPSRNPLFDVLVSFEESTWFSMDTMGDLKVSLYPVPQKFSRVDLGFYFREKGDNIELEVEYSTDLFELSSIKQMVLRFDTLVSSLLKDLSSPIKKVEILPVEEKRKVIEIFNDTNKSFDLEHTIDEMFQLQVQRTPKARAIIGHDGSEISFEELNRKIELLSNSLIEKGICIGDRIGVCFNRSPELIQVIFALLKAGCVYVPFLPGLPSARIDAMLEDAEIKWVICEESYTSVFQEKGVKTFTLKDLVSTRTTTTISRKRSKPSDLAYIIFTSGSTGRPKGVMVEHRSVLNRILWMQSLFPLSQEDVIIQKTPISFDVSIWELFWWSWTGATLAQLPPDGEKDPSIIVDYIFKRKGTVIHFVPSMLQPFLRYLERHPDELKKVSSLRYVFCSGEVLTCETVNRFNKLLYETYKVKLYNLYGPTEATVDVTWYPCSPLKESFNVPIGKPVPNTKIYILDEFNNPCPIGVTGELCISGVQVARGYINREDLTEKSFVEDPFIPSFRMYKTGDLARWRPDGVIEYLGRKDDQVKIRGFRVELGEVEAALEKIDGVLQAVARVTEIGSVPAIEAFLLLDNHKNFSREDLKEKLSSILPEYMIPVRFYKVDKIPLTPNGKVDRKGLKGTLIRGRRKILEKEVSLKQPVNRTQLEEEVTALWQKVLSDGCEFGINDNFFDVGGNSILLIKLHELFEERWPGVFSIPDLFVYVTISQQVSQIEKQIKKSEPFYNVYNVQKRDYHSDEPIAVIGMAVRLSDFEELDIFWSDLLKGADRICSIPESRKEEILSMLEAVGIDVSEVNFKEAAYLNDISGFDPEYFGIAPRDITLMDPEQRLFIETAFRAIEDSGYGGKALDNKRVGVFVGVSPSSLFKDAATRSFKDRMEQIYVINVPSNIASRLGYLKNWRGPAEVVDTACSSTLKAVLDACNSLQKGECEIAIAGGAKVLSAPIKGEKSFTIESEDGKTRTFDARANGTGAGEGAVAFVLKPLSKAIADKDAIRAVILGGAINQDGRAASIAAPNPEAQAEVIRTAAEVSGIDLCSIDFFEAHGTGTVLGDPVEIDGIKRAYEGKKWSAGKIPISSVKGNYGHLDAVAGALGMAKAILALQHGIVPKQPHFEIPNPKINFQEVPVFVPKENVSLDPSSKPWRCGVSAFGLSGINVHIILEEAPYKDPYQDDGKWYVIPLSAGSKNSLIRYVDLLIKNLSSKSNVSLRAVSSTLITGRYHLPYRIAFVCISIEDLISQLLDWRLNSQKLNLDPITLLQDQIEMGPFLDEEKALYAQRKFLEGFTPVWPSSEPVLKTHLPPVPLNRRRLWPSFKKSFYLKKKRSFFEPISSPYGKILNIPVHEKEFWPVSEHRIEGKPLLVGTGAVSIIGEVFSKKENEVLVIEDLYWKIPLFASQVNTACLVVKDGEVKLCGETKHGQWKDYITAKIYIKEDINKVQNVIDLNKILKEMSEYNFKLRERDDFIEVSHRWRCREKVWISKDRKNIAAFLKLNEQFIDDLNEFKWHPAMLDVGISLSIDKGGFVPAACKRIYLIKPFTSEVYVLAKVKEQKRFTIISDCIFLNKKGELLAKFEDISFVARIQNKPIIYPVVLTPFPQNFTKENILPKGEHIIVIEENQKNSKISQLYDLLEKRGYKILRTSVPDSYSGYELLISSILEVKAKRIIWEISDEENSWKPLFIFLKQLLLKRLRYPLRFVGLGTGVFSFSNKNRPSFSAISMGMLLCAFREDPLFSGQYIEIEGNNNEDEVINEILREGDIPDLERVIFFKNGNRLIRMPAEAVEDSDMLIKRNSVVVFTGGLGAMSLTLAKSLGEQFNIKPALIHRNPFPPEDKWKEIIDKGNDLDKWRVKQLYNMKEMGIEFKLYLCDVCDRKRLKHTLENIREQLGPIKGIIHTAGIAGSGFLINKTEEEFEKVLAPKVKGAINLHFLTLNDDLDFFVLASSRTGIHGAPGQSDYTGANAWLDSFARWRREKGLVCVSIDWNTWADIGMAARTNVSVKLKSESLLHPSQAKEVFLKAVCCGSPQVVVMMDDEELIHEKPSKSSIKEKKIRKTDSFESSDSIKAKIKRIWQEELGYEEELSDDSDFYALGGDSISGTNIIDRINKEFNLSLRLPDILGESSLKSFVELVKKEKGIISEENSSKESSLSIPKAPEREFYPVSLEQLAVIQAVVSSPSLNIAYNLPQFIKISKNVDIKRLEKAIKLIIERHEILRTHFINIQTPDPMMKILPDLDFKLQVVEVEKIDENVCRNQIEPFDLEKAPLFRAKLLVDKKGEKLLFMDFHHSIADARTIDILLGEIISFYNGKDLPLPPYQQKDIAWYQRQEISLLEESKKYWLDLFSKDIPILNLPIDRPRPPRHTGKGATYSFEIPSEWLPYIRNMAKKLSTTSYNLMLSLWTILIGRYANTNKLVISVAVDNRDKKEFENVTGMFVSLLPLMLEFSEKETLSSFIKRNHDLHSEIMRYRGFGLNSLLKELKLPVMPERTLLSEVTFSYMNFPTKVSFESNLECEKLNIVLASSKGDIGIFVTDLPEYMGISLEYYADIFLKERMIQIEKHFLNLLEECITKGPDKPIMEYSMYKHDEFVRLCDPKKSSFNLKINDLKEIISEAQKLEKTFSQLEVSDSYVVFSVNDKSYTITYDEILNFAVQLSEMGVKDGNVVVISIPLNTSLGIKLFLSTIAIGCVPRVYREKEHSGDVFIGKDVFVRRLLKWFPEELKDFKLIISLGDLPDTGLKGIISGFVLPKSEIIGCWRYSSGIGGVGNIKGKPSSNVEVYIIDDCNRVLPKGLWGKAVFKEKGIKKEVIPNARWNMEGELEIVGLNIDLPEEKSLMIYNTLMELNSVKEVVLWKRSEKEYNIVVSGDVNIDETLLKRILRDKLPVSIGKIELFVIHRPLPITQERDLDYEKIKEIFDKRKWSFKEEKEYDIRTLEEKIVKIFKEIFGKNVSNDDSFFELGGHSLLAMQIANRISDDLSLKLNVADIFEYPTPKELAEFLSCKSKEKFKEYSIYLNEESYFPLSHAQQRLYIMHHIEGGDVAYNMPFAFAIKGDFDLKIFSKALNKVCKRHEILRTTFEEKEGELWQVVHDECLLDIKTDNVDGDWHDIMKMFAEDMVKPFDLSKLPLFRVHIVFTKNETFILFVMHHIIGDGWSMQIMLSELMAFYEAEKKKIHPILPPLKWQYKDYAIWERHKNWEEATKFWKKSLKGVPYCINLPKDNFENEKDIKWSLGVVKKVIDPSYMLQLRKFASKKEVSLATLMFSLFAILLYRLSGQNDMLIGMGVAGRSKIEIENLIGFFVNIVPIRVQIDDDISFDELLLQINKSMLNALKRQDYPFDILVKELLPERRGGRESILNVVFEYQRYSDLGLNLPRIELPFQFRILDLDTIINKYPQKFVARYDFTLFVQDNPQNCVLKAEFDRSLFRPETIDKWLNYYEDFIKSVVREE